MNTVVIQFPGSNCDADCVQVSRLVAGLNARLLWHRDTQLHGADAVIIPGGFSYGDYLRCGAMAAHSPIMTAVKEFADRGGLVLGICNGFQILTETHLLPGVLVRNQSLRFVCQDVHLRVETTETPFSNQYQRHEVIRMPVAHGDGNYLADAATLEDLEKNKQIVFRYVNPQGEVLPEACPNGAVGNIAGICNRRRNVLGMMPHPERACEMVLGSQDGKGVFTSLLKGQSWIQQ